MTDPDKTKSDARLIRRSAVGHWPVTPALRAKLVRKIDAALDVAEDDPRSVASLGKVLTAMEAQNQADDHLEDKNKRLDDGKPTENAGGIVYHIVRATPPEVPNQSQA